MTTVDKPFEARTTLAIDIANRLLSLKGHPGFVDLVRISEQTVKAAEDALVNFEGWDRDELAARSIAFRAAKRSHEMLFVNMAVAIQTGIEEAARIRDANATPGALFSKEAADCSDELRAMVLQLGKNEYDTRVPGSF